MDLEKLYQKIELLEKRIFNLECKNIAEEYVKVKFDKNQIAFKKDIDKKLKPKCYLHFQILIQNAKPGFYIILDKKLQGYFAEYSDYVIDKRTFEQLAIKSLLANDFGYGGEYRSNGRRSKIFVKQYFRNRFDK